MDSKPITFKISPKEIKRRKKAILTLLTSLFVGFSIGMMNLKIVDLKTALIWVLIFLSILSAIGLLTLISFKSVSKSVVSLNNQYIERKTHKLKEKYLIRDIKSLYIKRTASGSIREVKITQKSGTYLFINAVENFEIFYNKLVKLADTNILEKQYIEPINFDHRFFYVFFGLPVGLCIPLLLSVFTYLNTNVAKYFSCSVGVIAIGTGLFCICSNPISKRYGNHKRLADFLFGATIISLGCFIFFQQYLYYEL